MSNSLWAISSPLVREPVPFVTRCRSRTVANGDSIRFDVRRYARTSPAGRIRAARWSGIVRRSARRPAAHPGGAPGSGGCRGDAAGGLSPSSAAPGRGARCRPGRHVGVHREPVELLLAPQERELEVAVVLVARERAAAASSLSGSCSTPRDGLNVLRSADAGTATNTSIGISSTRAARIAIPTIISPNSSSDADATVCSMQAVPTEVAPAMRSYSTNAKGNFQFDCVISGWRDRPVLDWRLKK